MRTEERAATDFIPTVEAGNYSRLHLVLCLGSDAGGGIGEGFSRQQKAGLLAARGTRKELAGGFSLEFNGLVTVLAITFGDHGWNSCSLGQPLSYWRAQDRRG